MTRRRLIASSGVEHVTSEAMLVCAMAPILCIPNAGVPHLAAHRVILVAARAAFALSCHLRPLLALAFAPVLPRNQLPGDCLAADLPLGKRGTFAAVTTEYDTGKYDEEKTR